jgi:hypothetical protein
MVTKNAFWEVETLFNGFSAIRKWQLRPGRFDGRPTTLHSQTLSVRPSSDSYSSKEPVRSTSANSSEPAAAHSALKRERRSKSSNHSRYSLPPSKIPPARASIRRLARRYVSCPQARWYPASRTIEQQRKTPSQTRIAHRRVVPRNPITKKSNLNSISIQPFTPPHQFSPPQPI